MAEALRKIEYYDDYSADTNVVKKQKNTTKTIRKQKSKIKFLYAAFCLACLFLSTLILSNYAIITSINIEINKSNAIINELKKTETSLVAKVEELNSNSDIVYEAQTKLGMIFPEKEQVVYFSINETLPENETIISKVFSMLTGNLD